MEEGAQEEGGWRREEKDGDRRRRNSRQDGRAQRSKGARSDHENTVMNILVNFIAPLDPSQNGSVGSNHGNLGPCPCPWRGVVTDPLKHCYFPR